MKAHIGLLSIFLFLTGCSALESRKEFLRVAFYNVENLFDTEDDPSINDQEFTPTGKNRWTSERYQKKLDNLTKVIENIAPDGPVLVGLAEIENSRVLADLSKSLNSGTGDYSFIHFDSKDRRGIDVALLYQEKIFEIESAQKINVSDNRFRTRDILYVSGNFKGSKESVHLLVNHFPSRLGGKSKSEDQRIRVATRLRAIVDSLLSIDSSANILLMGDFNDEPSDRSIEMVLKAKKEITSSPDNQLYNPMYELMEAGGGSYIFRDNNDMLDQLILSYGLTDNIGLDYLKNSAAVFNPEWLQQPTGKYKGYPARTFAGTNYLEGFSDHFPVYIDLVFK